MRTVAVPMSLDTIKAIKIAVMRITTIGGNMPSTMPPVAMRQPRNGSQDGANDRLQDRQSGKSSRAREHKSYEHGNRGYDSTFGDKDQYRSSYRQAYIQGYENGYNG